MKKLLSAIFSFVCVFALQTGYANIPTTGSFCGYSYNGPYAINQNFISPTIHLPETIKTVDASGGRFSFGYQINNDSDDLILTASAPDSWFWISDIVVSSENVTFAVAENNTCTSRCGKIYLQYGDSDTKEFIVKQTGISPESISFEVQALKLKVNEQVKVPVVVVPWDASLTWSSSDEDVVSVDSDGVLSAVGGGTATITAASGDKKATCQVKVSKLKFDFSLSATSLNLALGISPMVEILSDYECEFTASSDNINVAEAAVDGNRLIINPKSLGTATITVNSLPGRKYLAAKSKDISINVSEAFDLSSFGTANCYVVNKVGRYSFKATVKGNGTESVGELASADVLWESFGTKEQPGIGDVISNVSLSGGYVSFSVPFMLNGNAVIAVRDNSGTILWSWHIWVCENFDPIASAQRFDNKGVMMMDRNLGATSVSPGNVCSLGLLYQWGRKDPFLSSGSTTGRSRAASTACWPPAVPSDADYGTINYANSHPTTFIVFNNSNFDWCYTGSSATDDSRWKPKDQDKGLYDPCPYGWRVPDGGEKGLWYEAFGFEQLASGGPWDNTNKGMTFGNQGEIWFPAAGWLDNYNGFLKNVGSSGCYWTCTPAGYFAFENYFNEFTSVYPICRSSRAEGKSVRCVSE